jgi:hypothetical protein
LFGDQGNDVLIAGDGLDSSGGAIYTTGLADFDFCDNGKQPGLANRDYDFYFTHCDVEVYTDAKGVRHHFENEFTEEPASPPTPVAEENAGSVPTLKPVPETEAETTDPVPVEKPVEPQPIELEEEPTVETGTVSPF